MGPCICTSRLAIIQDCLPAAVLHWQGSPAGGTADNSQRQARWPTAPRRRYIPRLAVKVRRTVVIGGRRLTPATAADGSDRPRCTTAHTCRGGRLLAPAMVAGSRFRRLAPRGLAVDRRPCARRLAVTAPAHAASLARAGSGSQRRARCTHLPLRRAHTGGPRACGASRTVKNVPGRQRSPPWARAPDRGPGPRVRREKPRRTTTAQA